MANRKSDFITETRTVVDDLFDVLARIAALKREYDARGGSGFLVSGDFIGENADISEATFETAFGNLATINDYIAAQNYDDTWFPLLP